MHRQQLSLAALSWAILLSFPSISIGQVPPLPQSYVGIQSAGLGEAFSFTVSADGSYISRLTLGWNCPDRFPVAVDLASNVLPIFVDVNGRLRFSGRNIQVAVGSVLGIDGIIFDGDALDSNSEQAIGGLLLTRGASSCVHRWWATADPDTDLDGWNDRAEARLGSNANNRPSTPEQREVPLGLPLYSVGPCADAVDNDLDGSVDGADAGCTRLASAKELIIDFGPSFGIWTYGQNWTNLHSFNPEDIVVGDLDASGIDDVVVDFGDPYGLWVRLNNTSWAPLHGLSPSHMATGDLDSDGRDDVIIDFPGFGLYVWYNNTSWQQLHSLSASRFAIGNLDATSGDEVVVDFPGQGVWVYRNNSTWSQLHSLSSAGIVTGNFDGTAGDDVAIDFPGFGIWVYRNNTSWTQLHGLNAPRMAAGNLDGSAARDLVIDFGPTYGIWIVRNGAIWTQLHALTSEALMLGDLDGNGKDEIVVDFGSNFGLWVYMNTAWVLVHGLSPEGFATGNLN
jgi:hypothetical protein